MEQADLEFVGFWARFGAQLIDGLILIVATLPLLFIIYGEDYLASDQVVNGPADLVISWMFPAVASVWFWAARQATPGKMAIRAKIVDARTGHAAGIGQLIGRYLGYFVAALPLGLGLVWIAFDARKQGWHDKLAGTVVVRRKGLENARVVTFA